MRVVLPFKLVGQKLVKGRDFPKSVADGSKNTIVVKVDGIPENADANAYFKLSWENGTVYDQAFDGNELVVEEYIFTLPAHANNKYIEYKVSMSVAVFEDGEERLTTDPVEFVLNKSNYSDDTTNTPEIPQSQYELFLDDVKGYSVNPPKIGENGNWFVWNGTDYEDTGKPSAGGGGEGGGGSSIVVDDALDINSENPVQNAVVTENFVQLNNRVLTLEKNPNVDKELSLISTNPVQNKVITEHIQDLTQHAQNYAYTKVEVEDARDDYFGTKHETVGEAIRMTTHYLLQNGVGKPGKDGATFTPSVSSAGVLSWTNDKDLPNPDSVNIKGATGKDGVSATHSWNGTTLTIASASGTSSANLKGDKGDKGDTGSKGATGSAGKDGKTPVRGVDYYTEADKAEIVALVIESLGGNPVFGVVDGNNNILVSGNLPDGTYTVKYEMENGTKVNIGNLVLDTNVYYTVTNTLTNCTNSNSATKAVQGGSYSATISANSGYTLKSVTVTMGGQSVAVSGGTINIANVTGNIVITAVAEEVKTEPTNQIPISINSDKTLFVGQNGEKGYKLNTRISSSSGSESTSNASGIEVTGFIPVKYGDTVYLKDITVTEATTEVIGFYNSSFTKIVCAFAHRFGTTTGGVVSLTLTSDNIEDQNLTSALAYIRLSAKEINANSIITVNEPIV